MPDLDEGWVRTIDAGFAESDAHTWDGTVKAEVSGYNRRLKDTPGYIPVDDKLILAILWVESGGPKVRSVWYGRVMQMGRDAGITALKNHDGASELVIDPALLAEIDKAPPAKIDEPAYNIQTGIAYLFVRMARFENASLPDPNDTREQVVEVGKNDNASVIAKRMGTTVEELRASNPGRDIAKLRIGDELKFHKAHIGRRLTGWEVFNEDNIGKLYNTKTPVNYAAKLRYVRAKLQAWQR